MTKLENTIMDLAENYLSMLRVFGECSDKSNFANTWQYLSSLLMIGNLKDSGLTDKSISRLNEIEDESKAIYRKYTKTRRKQRKLPVIEIARASKHD